MTDSITPEQWKAIANEVTSLPKEREWRIAENGRVYLYTISTGENLLIEFNPEYMVAQQLRLADYLAEKGVHVRWNTLGKCFIAETYASYRVKVRHKNIKYCRALAVLALIGERL